MISIQDISDALAVCEAASKGPAVWAAGKNDTLSTALERLAAHVNKAYEVTGSAVLHQVDLHDDRTESDSTALCFAVTGNGPNGGANARFVAGALDPQVGWEATLRELVHERAVLMKIDAILLEAIAAVGDFIQKKDPVDAWLVVQHLDRVLMKRDGLNPSRPDTSAPAQLERFEEMKTARNEACAIAISLQRRLAFLEREHPEVVSAQPNVEPELWRLKRVGYVPLPGDDVRKHATGCRCNMCVLSHGGSPLEEMRARGDEK